MTREFDGLTPRESTFWKGLAAGTVNLAIGSATAPLAARALVIAAGLLVGVFAYGVSTALYISAAQALGATRAQTVFASAPFFGAVLSMLLLGETLGPVHLGSALLFIAGVGLLGLERHAHVHEHGQVVHEHAHRHDDGHHAHGHPEAPPALWHTHRHQHGAVEHRHPHWPDLHHRHEHDQKR